ncbi:hypothetical protein [Rhodobacter capsulatus]|uniref:hypothetical protein n=1 Tax=Rhodobacter capsulatus TaxID=1061 RepID=UPI0009B8F8C9|nr:hypothetical protein [Rhodobacter capsulatus]
MTGSDLAALFICASSPYLALGVDCYDVVRDARTYSGSGKVIAHPPCRSWGRYKAVAKPRPGERELALWALDLVRRNGGVLEHPASSGLWRYLQPGETTLLIRQADFGHRAEKLTRLFYARMPRVPLLPDRSTGPFVPVENMCRQERERTPRLLAEWLVTWCRS